MFLPLPRQDIFLTQSKHDWDVLCFREYVYDSSIEYDEADGLAELQASYEEDVYGVDLDAHQYRTRISELRAHILISKHYPNDINFQLFKN